MPRGGARLKKNMSLGFLFRLGGAFFVRRCAPATVGERQKQKQQFKKGVKRAWARARVVSFKCSARERPEFPRPPQRQTKKKKKKKKKKRRR